MWKMLYKTFIARYPREQAVFTVISGIIRMNNITRRFDVNYRSQVTDLLTSEKETVRLVT